jgi:hypothetical protein
MLDTDHVAGDDALFKNGGGFGEVSAADYQEV